MEFADLFADIRARQLSAAALRAEQLEKGHHARAEQHRGELVALLQAEEHLMRALAEVLDLLDRQPESLHLPHAAYLTRTPGSKRALPPGTVLEAVYKGKTIKAHVNSDGKLGYKGKTYNSIAALANEVTGKDKNHLRNRKFWKINIPCSRD